MFKWVMILVCVGRFCSLVGSDSVFPESETTRFKYGELRTCDLLRQQAISGATHQDDPVWLHKEDEYRVAIEQALDYSRILIENLQPSEYLVDEKGLISDSGESAEMLIELSLGKAYPYEPTVFDDSVTVHDLDFFNLSLKQLRDRLYEALPAEEPISRVKPLSAFHKVSLKCSHGLCRDCFGWLQKNNLENAKCPSCREVLEARESATPEAGDDVCPVCMDRFIPIKVFTGAINWELRLSPIKATKK